jgi:tetratricopeptide (TPR) repeat protein
MAIWYPSVLSYKEFAQANSFIKDITRTVDNQSVTLNTRIDELISSVNKNNNLVAANTLQITSAVEQGFAHIAEINQRGFGYIVSSVQALQSDINFNFEQIIHELEYQNKILDSILTTIQSPFETKVKEYYRKGCDLDKGGILDKAIEYFNKSISLPTGDIFFSSFYQLGKIYLDRVESEYNAIDLKLASDNLRLANKYGSGILRNNPSFKPILADCKFYLSLSLFRQLTGNSSSEYENSILNEAIFFAKESIILNPLLSSSMYY